jgi:hypothetical protein
MSKKPLIEIHRIRTKAKGAVPKASPDRSSLPAQVTDPITARELLFGASGLPSWQGSPDPAKIYSHAVKELVILSRLAPDLGIKLEASKFLAAEFRPVAQESEEARERRLAFSQIDQILRAKGIAPPQEPTLEMEVVREGEARAEPSEEEQTAENSEPGEGGEEP